jgi:hypothetical protein
MSWVRGSSHLDVLHWFTGDSAKRVANVWVWYDVYVNKEVVLKDIKGTFRLICVGVLLAWYFDFGRMLTDLTGLIGSV